MDLDYFIQSSIDETKDKEQIDTEIKIFQNALDFSNIKIRDCLIPRTEIIAVDIESTIQELKDTFIENGISKVIVYKDNIDNVIGYIHSSELFRHPQEWQKNIRPSLSYRYHERPQADENIHAAKAITGCRC